MRNSYLLSSFLLCTWSLKAQNYDLDSTFGINARQIFTRGTGNSGLFDAETQPDGKVLSAGSMSNFTRDILVTRHLTNGTPDNSFGTAGMAAIDLGGDEFLNDLELQADGKMVVCGQITLPGEAGKFLLARLNANGTLDNSFGTNGRVVFSAFLTFNGSQCEFRNLAIQPDGKIIATGFTFKSSTQEYVGMVQRYEANGTLDITFGTGGSKQITYNNGSHNFPEAPYVLPDGKILITGNSLFNFYLHRTIRLNPDGTTDNTFGTNGIAANAFPGFPDVDPRWITVLPDGKIMTIGFAYNGTVQKVFSSRHLATGQLDPAYGTGGFSTYAATTSSNYAYDAVLHSNGDFSIPVEAYNSTTGIVALIRINSEGALVPAFGINGIKTYALEDDAFSSAIAQSNDSLFIVGGMTGDADRFSQGYLVKVDGSGDLISGFATQGIRKIGSGISASETTTIIPGDGGNMYITGTHSNRNKDQFAAKIDANGNAVPGFGDNGFSIFDIGKDENLKDAIRTSDGRLLLLSTTGKTTYTYSGIPVSFTAPTHYSLSVIDAAGATQGQSNFTVTTNHIPGVRSVREDNNGKFIVSVSSIPGLYGTFYLRRHNANLTVDNTFGVNGKIELGSNSQSFGRDRSFIQVAPDNDIIALTYYTGGSGDPLSTFRVYKYDETGELDNTFGNFPVASCYLDGDTIGQDPNGVRNFWKFSNGYYTSYVKAGQEKILHLDFGGGVSTFGRVTIGPDKVVDMKELPDGSFLILCNDDELVKIYHYFANGTLDTAFNTTGVIEGIPFPECEILEGFVVNADSSVVIYHQFGTTDQPSAIGLSKFSLKDAVLGAAELNALVSENDATVFPNPFEKGVYVETKNASIDLSEFEFTLYDAAGRSLPISILTVSANSIYIESKLTLSAGTYLLNGKSRDNKLIQRTLVK